MKRLAQFLWAIALSLTLTACGAKEPPAAAVTETPALAQSGAATAAAPMPAVVTGLPDFSALVAAYGSTVVNVTTIAQREVSKEGTPGLTPDDPFYDFFKRFGFGSQRPQPPQLARGEGSGFLISADGYVLTNAHVVDRAREVTVRTTDRREYRAKVVGVDVRTDVAVLKIGADKLPFVRIGSPAALKAGQYPVPCPGRSNSGYRHSPGHPSAN